MICVIFRYHPELCLERCVLRCVYFCMNSRMNITGHIGIAGICAYLETIDPSLQLLVATIIIDKLIVMRIASSRCPESAVIVKGLACLSRLGFDVDSFNFLSATN